MSKLEAAARQALEALVRANADEHREGPFEYRAKVITALREALAEQAAEPVNFVVSAVLVKDTHAGINTQNRLYPLFAVSRDEAHGKVLSLLESDFPEHRLHTICSYELPAPTQQAAEPVVLGPLARRRVFDYIRGAYDLGYSDARNAKAVPGDGAPGYKGRDVEADHGGALLNALNAQVTQQVAEPVAEVKLMERGGNAGLATAIHEIYSPERERLQPGTKLYTQAPTPQPPRFPAMLRKMWSGGEVQQWIDENWSTAHGITSKKGGAA